MAYSRSEPFSSIDIPDDEWAANVAAWKAAQGRFDPVAARLQFDGRDVGPANSQRR